MTYRVMIQRHAICHILRMHRFLVTAPGWWVRQGSSPHMAIPTEVCWDEDVEEAQADEVHQACDCSFGLVSSAAA